MSKYNSFALLVEPKNKEYNKHCKHSCMNQLIKMRDAKQRRSGYAGWRHANDPEDDKEPKYSR